MVGITLITCIKSSRANIYSFYQNITLYLYKSLALFNCVFECAAGKPYI